MICKQRLGVTPKNGAIKAMIFTKKSTENGDHKYERPEGTFPN